MRVEGFECRVQGSGFRVQGSGFRVQGSGFRAQNLGFRTVSSLSVLSKGGRSALLVRRPLAVKAQRRGASRH